MMFGVRSGAEKTRGDITAAAAVERKLRRVI
jgi:hypothetical protein